MRELLLCKPLFTHNIWGGERLHKDFGYEVEGNDIGECWGIAAHSNGDSIIANGEFAGWKLSKLYQEHKELFGNVDSEVFPLLIKIIDANDNLSIQVHPSDEYAKVNENGSLGKTECWYIMDCPEKAELVVGHNAKNREELSDMIHEGRWNEFIRKIPIARGDFIQIDPGTVHAITAGVLLLETQQNSDITYRVYDYDRLSNGKPRELHVDKSIDVITVPADSAADSVKHFPDEESTSDTVLISNDYYTVRKITVKDQYRIEVKDKFLNISVIDGGGTINGTTVNKGAHLIVPAGIGNLIFEGNMIIICSMC